MVLHLLLASSVLSVLFVQNAKEQSKQQLTPEVMELVQSADGYRSMWRHQTEHYLFKYNMLTQQAAVTFAFGDRKTQFKPVCEVLDSDDSKYKYDDSVKRFVIDKNTIK